MSNPMDDFFNAGYDDFDPNAGNNPKPDDGMSILIVRNYGPKQTQKAGAIMTCDFVVAQAAPGGYKGEGPKFGPYRAGDLNKMAWFVNDSRAINKRYERKRSDEFLTALLGLPEKTACGPHSAHLSHPQQPGVGIMVKCFGERNGKFLNYRFEHIPQTQETIAANRAAVMQIALTEGDGLPAAPTAPQHVNQAPHPAAMPAGHYGQPGQGQIFPTFGQAPAPVIPVQPQPIVPAQPQIGLPNLPTFKF